jgi:hypothetical protein
MVESLLLSLASGVAGIVARWTLDLLLTVGAARIPRVHELSLDWTAFAFLLLICGVVAVLFDWRRRCSRRARRRTTSEVFRRPRNGDGRVQPDARQPVIAEVALAFILALGVAGW